MSSLVTKLKDEHKLIFSMFEKVKSLGIGSRNGREELFKVKELILSHLKTENEYIYPRFAILSQKNPSLKGISDKFQNEMTDISKQAIAFFDKYLADSTGFEFGKDYAKLYLTLSSRMKDEENVLYTEFDKYA